MKFKTIEKFKTVEMANSLIKKINISITNDEIRILISKLYIKYFGDVEDDFNRRFDDMAYEETIISIY